MKTTDKPREIYADCGGRSDDAMIPKYEVKWWERVYHSTIVEARNADEANMIFSDSGNDEITGFEFGDVTEIEEWNA